MLDLLIKNAKYPNFKVDKIEEGSIGIKDHKIVSLNENSQAKQIFDANGYIVSPGFIDIHMHEDDFKSQNNKYFISKLMLKMGVTTAVGGNCGIQFQTVKEFKDIIEKNGGSPVNYLMFSGYNHYRELAGKGNYDSIDKKAEQKIRESIQKDFDNGAIGISFGIEYAPSLTTEEMINQINNFTKYNPLIAAHYRSDADGAIDSIYEMIDISKETNTRFQISHLSSCSAMGQMRKALNIINEEMSQNENINYDTYPYDFFSTYIGSTVFDEGCFERWNNTIDCILVVEGKYKGQRCNREIFDELRNTAPNTLVACYAMKEEEIKMSITNSKGMIASDSLVSDGSGHPRAAGTFPRILGKYVREEKALDLLLALKKMTLLPAERLGLINKGRISVNSDADLVIFDPATIIDGADTTDLFKPNQGIKRVYIGGDLALENGEILREDLGEFIGREKLSKN